MSNKIINLDADVSISGSLTAANIYSEWSSAQPDWNQTDETKADYIKNKPNIKNGEGAGSLIMKNGDDPAVHYINESAGNGNLVTGDRNKAFGVKCLVTGTANDTHGNSNTVTGQSHKTTNKTAGLLISGNSNKIYNSIYSTFSGQDNADALEADGSDVVDFASTANNQSVIVLGKKNRVRKNNNSLVAGYNNKIYNYKDTVYNNVILGSDNDICGGRIVSLGDSNFVISNGAGVSSNSVQIGQKNSVTLGYSNVQIGNNLKTTGAGHRNRTQIGQYNDSTIKSDSGETILLELANGTSNSNRKSQYHLTNSGLYETGKGKLVAQSDLNEINAKLDKVAVTDEDFNIKANLAVSGDLNVKGSVVTVNQETLAVKDNIIITNAAEEATPYTGTVAVTGKKITGLVAGTYALQDLVTNKLEITDDLATAILRENISCSLLDANNNVLLSGTLKASYNEMDMMGDIFIRGILYFNNVNVDENSFYSYSWDPYYYKSSYSWSGYSFPMYIKLEKDHLFKNEESKTLIETLIVNPIFSWDQLEAYALPLFNTEENVIQIGKGLVDRDENNNITGFTFLEGQAQALATRANEIENDSLLKWDEVNRQIVSAGTAKKLDRFNIEDDNSLSIEGDLRVSGALSTSEHETLSIKDNIIVTNSSEEATPYAGLVAVTGVKTEGVAAGRYEFTPETMTVTDVTNFRKENFIVTLKDKNGDNIDYGTEPQRLYIYYIEPEYGYDGIEIFPEVFEFSYGDIPIYASTYGWGIDESRLPLYIELDNDYIYQNASFKTTLEKFFKNIKYSKPGIEAYALPLYNTEENTIQIGRGTVEKDENNNITGFTFLDNQAQSLATRENEITDKNLLIWDELGRKITDSGISVDDLQKLLNLISNLSDENIKALNDFAKTLEATEGV
jgi:hypothetical protein